MDKLVYGKIRINCRLPLSSFHVHSKQIESLRSRVAISNSIDPRRMDDDFSFSTGILIVCLFFI